MLKNYLKHTAVVLMLGVAAAANAEEGISIANGKAKMNALTSFWFVNDTSLNQVNTNAPKFDMVIRHAELAFSGALSDSTRWMVEFDLANPLTKYQGNTSVLNDLVISQTLLLPELTLDLGQFKIPTVAESLDPDGQLMFPERSMVARAWGESRQPGAMLSYKAKTWKLAGMISNGSNAKGDNIANNGQGMLDAYQGTNDSHPNNKDLTFRFDMKPMDMVSFGAFTYFPSYNWGQGGAYGANLRLLPIEDLVIRGEYVRGWVKMGNDDQPRNGYTIDAGYMYGDWQPVARYEIQQMGVTASAATFGLNYYMMKHNSKLQIAYTLLGANTAGSDAGTEPSGTASATGLYAPATSGAGGTLTTVAFQIAI